MTSVGPIALTALFFFQSAFTFAQAPQSAATAAALAELNRGNVFEGVRRLKEIVRADPSSASAYFYLSSLYTRIGRYDTAYRYLEIAMKASPGQGAYYHQLGIIRRYEGCRPEALAAFQQALRAGIGKEEATIWRHIGEVQVDLVALDKAIEAYRNALRIEPNDAASHLALGKLYLDRNDPGGAVPELLAALKIEPSLEGVHASLGRAYRALGDLQSAVTILKQGIDRNASDQESRYVLAQVLLTLRRDDEGRREMEIFRRVQDQISQTNSTFERAVGSAQAGELDRAEDLLTETLRLAPRYAPALRVLGTIRLDRGNSPRRAVEMLQQALTLNPLHPETYFALAAAYHRDGKLTEAVDMIERALVLDEEDSRYYALLGAIYSKMNQTAKAKTAVEQAARLRSQPGYKAPAPYGFEGRPRDDSATVRQICDGPPSPIE
jgi:superkiller protein 3